MKIAHFAGEDDAENNQNCNLEMLRDYAHHRKITKTSEKKQRFLVLPRNWPFIFDFEMIFYFT